MSINTDIKLELLTGPRSNGCNSLWCVNCDFTFYSAVGSLPKQVADIPVFLLKKLHKLQNIGVASAVVEDIYLL